MNHPISRDEAAKIAEDYVVARADPKHVAALRKLGLPLVSRVEPEVPAGFYDVLGVRGTLKVWAAYIAQMDERDGWSLRSSRILIIQRDGGEVIGEGSAGDEG